MNINTKARQAKFLKRDDAWVLVEEVGGINPCSLLERHADGSYHILGDESSTAGGLKVYNESNTYASWLKAPLAANLSADVDFVLPASEGSNGQLLQTDGNGNTSWVTPSSGGSAEFILRLLILLLGMVPEPIQVLLEAVSWKEFT